MLCGTRTHISASRTTMIQTINVIGLFTILHLTAGHAQRPSLTRCNIIALDTMSLAATYAPFIRIESVHLASATLGQTLRAELKLRVYPTFGFNPALEFFINTARAANTSSGMPLPCAYSVVPKQLRFCGGGTDKEKLFSAEWSNTCPIKAGTYTARLSFELADGLTARSCVDDGKLEATLRIKDECYILDCVSFPVTIGLN